MHKQFVDREHVRTFFKPPKSLLSNNCPLQWISPHKGEKGSFSNVKRNTELAVKSMINSIHQSSAFSWHDRKDVSDANIGVDKVYIPSKPLREKKQKKKNRPHLAEKFDDFSEPLTLITIQ